VILVCSPSNPTGAVHTIEDLEVLARGIEQARIAWISDEVYAGYCYDGALPTLRMFAPESGVTIGGVSKDASMTGWRIGWAVGPREVVEKIVAVHQHLVTCASSVSQCAARGALSLAGRATSREYGARFARRRVLMGEELARIPALDFERPDGAFYFFPAVSGCVDSEALALRLMREAGVITIPGVAFGPAGEGRLRLSFAASEDDIVRGVRAIGAVLGRRVDD
jgi:aspartate/methionine/tyrosine aminotransferase